MRIIKHILLLLVFIAVSTGCKKSSSGGGGGVVNEENLIIAIDPDPGNTIAQSLGSNYTLNILVQSRMPALGVTIDINCKKESDNTAVFSQSLQSTTSPVMATINGLPFNEVTIVTITIKSRSTSTNTASKTFRLVKK